MYRNKPISSGEKANGTSKSGVDRLVVNNASFGTFDCIPKEFHCCHYEDNCRRHLVRIFLRIEENSLSLKET